MKYYFLMNNSVIQQLNTKGKHALPDIQGAMAWEYKGAIRDDLNMF
jgi:hypothetical protein